MEEVYKYIDSQKNEYINELFSFLRIPSVSLDSQAVKKCADFLVKIMERAGIKTRIYKTDGNPIVYGELGNRENNFTVLIYDHYDVQPADNSELWDNDPFEPVIRNGKIYARGASDDKGQLFANIKGIEAYKKIKSKLPVNFKFLFEGEEEISSPNLRNFLSTNRELLKSDLLIGSDAEIHYDGSPAIYLGNKGYLYIEITVQGANRDLHSAVAPAVPSAIWRMISLLSTLKGEDGIVKIEGFYDGVRPLLESEIEAAKKIPYNKKAILSDFGIEKLIQNRNGDQYYYNLMFEPTCNIDGIWGGFTSQGKKTVLPHKASAKIDMRLVPNQNWVDISKKLKAYLDKNGYGDAKINVLGTANPDRPPINDRYLDIIKDAIREIWKKDPVVYPSLFGTNPSYLFAEYLDLHLILIPFALTDNHAHAPNENFDVDSLVKGIKVTSNIIEKISMGTDI